MPEAFFLAFAETSTPAEAAAAALQSAGLKADRLNGAFWGCADDSADCLLELPRLNLTGVSCGAASALAAVQMGVQTILCQQADVLLAGGAGGSPSRSAAFVLVSAAEAARQNWMPRAVLRAFRWDSSASPEDIWTAVCKAADLAPDEVERVWSDAWFPSGVPEECSRRLEGVQGAVLLARLLAELESTGATLGAALVSAPDGAKAAAILERI